MNKAGPKVAARQGGGFRQGFGNFNEEHLEQQASSSAVQQKQLAQQQTTNAQQQTTNTQQTPAQQVKQQPPRELSDVKDELVTRPVRDVVKGLKSLFDINSILGINPGDTPEEQEHKKQLNQQFNKLTEEQQAVAKKRYQQEMEKNRDLENEKEQKKQAKAEHDQQAKQMLTTPSSPRKGAVGPAGSKKQRATQQLQQQRQSIGQIAGAN